MNHFKIVKWFSKNLEAHQYMKSVSQKALTFKPKTLRQLTKEETLADRVVKAFFNAQSEQIKIFEAANRITSKSYFSTPTHSYYQVLLPFQKNLLLRNKFIKYWNNGARVGRILEIMDYIAANVGYRYCLHGTNQSIENLDFSIVTACVDHINFFIPITVQKDCIFSGYVTFVGSTSIEIQIDAKQPDDKGQQVLNCSATFVMVARDKTTHNKFTVPTINLEQQDYITKINYELGVSRRQRRIQFSKKSLYSLPPSFQESSEIHSIYLNSEKKTKTQNSVIISETKLDKILLMHLQNRNLHGKIFGGYIMREAFELGWLCAYMYVAGASFPEIYHIDDIQFISSVQVGSSLKFEAVVAYVQKSLIHVIVKCVCVKPDGSLHRTNQLRLSFLASNPKNRIVLPYTYAQTILYLCGKRAVQGITT